MLPGVPLRYLALDVGDKRTGLAIGDDELRLAVPLDVIELPLAGADGGARLIDTLVQRLRAEGAGAVVIGLPLNMDGTEGPQARKVRALGDQLIARAAIAAHYQDERLTTDEAHWDMAGTGLSHAQKKARRDALAAAAILRDFLATLPRTSDDL